MLRTLSIVAILLTTATTTHAQNLVRVPADAADIPSAIAQVTDGGIIELAAGTYFTPAGGFQARFLGKRFTVRAASGANVILDGNGDDSIFTIEDNPGGLGTFRFEDLTFRNGFTAADAGAGGVHVLGAPVFFSRCRFADNHADGNNASGGVRIANAAQATFVDTVWENNTALRKGAALGVYFADVVVRRNRFRANRTDVVGHGIRAAAGAIFVLDGSAVIERSRFENNRAASVGGAINAFGVFDTAPTPATRIEILDSTFLGNVADENPCCPSGRQEVGGAIHVEDDTELIVRRSRFEGNVATWGGAISSFRGLVDIEGSTFRGNRARTDDIIVGVGGTIAINSADRGEENLPSGRLIVRRSLIQGRFGDTQTAGTQGGCIFLNGDQNRLFGNGDVPQSTNLPSLWATATIEETILQDCDVAPGATTDGVFGGAIAMLLADLELTNSLIFDSDATGPNAIGGAISLATYSRARVVGSRLGFNTAETRGGAIHAGGSELQVDGSTFLGNEISPGVSEGITASTGAAILTTPFLGSDNTGLDRAARGTVSNTLFTENVGLPLWEIDLANGPINAMRYNGNRFFETTFPGLVFNNIVLGFGGQSVGTLNGLTVFRPGAPSSDKSDGGNQALGNRPRDGDLVAAPSNVRTNNLPPGEPALAPAYLGWVWSGNNANIDGSNLTDRAGSRAETQAGERTLVIDGTPVAAATITADGMQTGSCVATATRMCIADRFQVEVRWETLAGEQGMGNVVQGVGSADSGLFYFFEPDNWEMLVKVLDGCGITNHYWVFAAATTNLGLTLTVTDTVTSESATYSNPPGSPAPATTDATALPVCP